MEEIEAKPVEKAIMKKTPLEPAVILPEKSPIEQEESTQCVHSEPAPGSLKLANLNLADIKPFYPRSEREQREERERDRAEQNRQQLERNSLYAEVAGRRQQVSSLRAERDEIRNVTSADRVIRMTERDLLEEQRRMRGHGLAETYLDHPSGDGIPRRAEDSLRVSPHLYPRSYEEQLRTSSRRHTTLPPSGMELLEQNLERRLDPAYDRAPGAHVLYRTPSNISIHSSRDRSEHELWSDYKKERSSHYAYPTRSSYPAFDRMRSGMSERERQNYYSHGGRLPATLSDFPPRGVSLGTRRTSSRMSESSRYRHRMHPDPLDYDLYRYEDLCKSDPIYDDPTQDNEFFMYQMMAAEENAKREKLCGVAAVIPPEQVAKATAPKKETQKSRICRHFLRGHCKFGESCNFFHGAPLVHASDQLVFLGGLPSGITSDMLIEELNVIYGVEVLNKPQIFSNFSPRVALSLDDAKLLKGHGKLTIFSRQVDVRAFEDNSKSEAEKCMVFLGGLPEGIKLTELISQLRKKGIQVMNKPYLGDGYARNVQVQSEKHANDLIRKRKIFLFSSSVDVRPYVNVYGKKKDDDNGTVIPDSMLPHNQRKVKKPVAEEVAPTPLEPPASLEPPATADKEEHTD